MVERLTSYRILAMTLAISGGLIFAVILVTYLTNPLAIKDGGFTWATALIGLVTALYFFSIHQFIKAKHQGLSTGILGLLSAANLLLIIAQTGGLDSSFYSLWLLAIVISGFFGFIYTVLILSATTGYFTYALASHQFSGTYLRAHLLQFLISLAAGGLAEWIHHQGRHADAKTQRATGQLTAEQLKAQMLMSAIADGVMVVNRNREIEFFNQAAQTITGWDIDSAQGLNYRLILNLRTAGDQEVPDAADPFMQAWTKREPMVIDNLSTITKSGRKIALSLSISPMFDAAGQVTGGIALIRDISDLLEAERQRSEFISTASHEMRTPIAAIEGYIALAMNSSVATIDDRARGFLEKAHDATQHMGKLFRDLLSITKMEDNQLAEKSELVELGKLLQTVVSDMQFSANKKNLSVIYKPSSVTTISQKTVAPLYYVMANSARLREVILNLVDNAIKFTPAGEITVTITGDKKIVTVGVNDTGQGIPPEDLPHLFQKFYRVDSSATRTVGGTGLGLYLCRNVIERFNGRIWAESTPGRGSTFKFSLPRLSNEQAAALTQSPPTVPVANPNPPAVKVPVGPAAGH